MRNIARASSDERERLFDIASKEMHIKPAVIEKDFWVCYTLAHLFNNEAIKDHIVFKGGTSLSKAFGLIDRFSEDIDLILDWRVLGYGLEEPWEERSNTQQDKFKLDSIERTNKYLADKFAPMLKESISVELGIDAEVYLGNEEETVIFAYPRIHELSATLDVIRLEIGPMAAWTPSVTATITPYLAECRPQFFDTPATNIKTVAPERSFWEKVTILHQEANRPESKNMLDRYSRHYYDVYKLGHSGVKDNALMDLELLDKVVAFKQKFYRTPWAHLEDCKPGTVKLVVPEYRLAGLNADYTAMQDMLTAEAPTFNEIMDYMQELQNELNNL
jgi:predicted nucleotidyltransferase component of viral defense system